jgi:hypothetical protein
VARSAGLVVRVVLVHGARASNARRRVADLLLRAADASPPPVPPGVAEGAPPVRSGRASDDAHMTDP